MNIKGRLKELEERRGYNMPTITREELQERTGRLISLFEDSTDEELKRIRLKSNGLRILADKILEKRRLGKE